LLKIISVLFYDRTDECRQYFERQFNNDRHNESKRKMKKLINEIKAGLHLAPALLIYIYILLGVLDLTTTYLASPDLQYEGNWVVKKFNFNWTDLIIYASINYLITILFFVFSLNYLMDYYQAKNVNYKNLFFRKIKFFASIIILGLFYSHFICECHVILNNLLGVIYLKGERGVLKDISVYYMNRQKYFLFYIQYVTYIPGFIIAYIKLSRIKKRAIIQVSSRDVDFMEVH